MLFLASYWLGRRGDWQEKQEKLSQGHRAQSYSKSRTACVLLSYRLAQRMIVQVKKVKFSTNHTPKANVSDQKTLNGTIPFVDQKTRNLNCDTD